MFESLIMIYQLTTFLKVLFIFVGINADNFWPFGINIPCGDKMIMATMKWQASYKSTAEIVQL